MPNTAIVIAAFMLFVVGGIIAITQGQRKIPVQYAKKIVGRRVYGGANTHIPLKVNTAGVIPIIFAQSIIMFPGTLGAIFPDSASRYLSTVFSDEWMAKKGLLWSLLRHV